jgi:enoyl-CoA hydratase/carnithine racemase
MLSLPSPVDADLRGTAVNGAAVGVGATVILPMDFRITYSEAKVGFPFAARGIVTDAASSYFLPKIAGMSNALALTMTASILPARHKWLAPLWADVLDGPAEVLPRALELAADIAARCSVVSTALIKNMMWRAPLDPEQHHLLDSIGVYLTSQRDGQEGVKSFLEKRPPKFTDSIADPTIQGFLRMTRARL